MATAFTVDLTGLAQKIASALSAQIQEGVAEAMTIGMSKGLPMLPSAPSLDVKQPEPNGVDLSGIRAQILANTQILYPLWFGAKAAVPDLQVILTGDHALVQASVVYATTTTIPTHFLQSIAPRVTVLFRTTETTSVATALEMLLAMTSKYLTKELKTKTLQKDDCRKVMNEFGVAYAPLMKTDRGV